MNLINFQLTFFLRQLGWILNTRTVLLHNQPFKCHCRILQSQLDQDDLGDTCHTIICPWQSHYSPRLLLLNACPEVYNTFLLQALVLFLTFLGSSSSNPVSLSLHFCCFECVLFCAFCGPNCPYSEVNIAYNFYCNFC